MEEKMLSMLIADDEPIIADRMFRIFSEYPQFEAYKAYNGLQALELVEKKRIDLALLDISMPKIDGMAVMKRLKELWPDAYVIFLTGYKSFDYAYESIRHDRVKYILKSEGEAAIRGAVDGTLREMEEEHSQQALLERARRQLAELRPLILQNALSRILAGEEAEALRSLLPKEDRLYRPEGFFFALCEITFLPAASKRYSLLTWLLGLLRDLLREPHLGFPGPEENQLCLVIFQNAQSDNIIPQLQTIFEQTQNVLFSQYGARVSFLLSDAPLCLAQMKSCYLLLNRTAKTHCGMELLCVEGKQEGKPAESAVLNDRFAGLRQALYAGNKEDFSACCEDIRRELRTAGRQELLLLWHRVCSLFLEFYAQRSDDPAENAGLAALLSFSEFYRSERLIDLISASAEAVFQRQKASLLNHSEQLIAQTNAYIESHLNGDLSLSALAGRVYLNRSYFSRLYKQVTGENLSDFINTRRMERAKELLSSTQDKISDIALQVGFDSPSYFTVYFKKFQGISPIDYRESTQGA